MTYHSHNAQLRDYGACHCACHRGSNECECGWLTFFPRPVTRTKLRPTGLTSRVRAFAKKRSLLWRITNHIYQPKERHD